MAENARQWNYFTFGSAHAHPNGAVAIFGTYEEARAKMFDLYGNKWAFQYTPCEWGNWHVAHPTIVETYAANADAAAEMDEGNMPVAEDLKTAYIFKQTQAFTVLREAVDSAVTVGELMAMLAEANADDKVILVNGYSFGTLVLANEFHY